VEEIAERLARVPGVVAVTLGGSRATGEAAAESDWDFGLYYRGTIDPDDVRALGWQGQVFAPGEWGAIVNGGAWLEVDGVRVDLIYRDLDEVLHWTAAAEQGRFRVDREVGYVAGIPTYLLAAELALGKVLGGELPRPEFPAALRTAAPPRWTNLALGALHFAAGAAGRNDRVGCLANVTVATLAVAHARLARDGIWTLNEKRIVDRAGLGAVGTRLHETDDLGALARDARALLALDGAHSPWRSAG
jgi:hypothetical protein